MARQVSKGKLGNGRNDEQRGGASRKAGVAEDARNRIISKQRLRISDAREKLVSLTKKSGDARKRLEKIRNLKMGKLDVKTTAKGGITITTTTQGKTLLTTKKKGGGDAKKASKAAKTQQEDRRTSRNVRRTVGRGGTTSFRTAGNKVKPTLSGVAKTKSSLSSGLSSKRKTIKQLTRTIKGEMSEAAKLDMELMNTKVDPVILKRTVNNDGRNKRRSSSPSRPASYRSLRPYSPDPSYGRYRMGSPIDLDSYGGSRGGGGGRSRYHYDDPRREMEREESYSRKLQWTESFPSSSVPTMADRFDSTGGSYASPLEGCKVIVSNLSGTVTRDDIIELFGDVGGLKRAKVSTPGTSEVVFVNRADAQKAVEIYHNRQLDGKAMRCQIVGAGGLETSNGAGFKLPSGGGKDLRRGSDTRGSSGMSVELNSIHKALFSDRKLMRSDRNGSDTSFRRPRY